MNIKNRFREKQRFFFKVTRTVYFLFLIVLLIGVSAIPTFLGFKQPIFTLHSANFFATPLGQAVFNHTYGGDGRDLGESIIELSSGEFVIAGTTDSDTSGESDMWLVKTDAGFNYIWEKKFGGSEREEGEAVIECSDGGFAITGSTETYTLDFVDIWLVRTEADGSRRWSYNYGTPNSDRSYSVVECEDGGFLIAGDAYKDNNEFDLFLIKTHADGTEEWRLLHDENKWDHAEAIIECSSGGYAIAGWTGDEFDNGMWFLRIDSGGNIEGNYIYGGGENDWGYSLVESPEGNFAIVGDSMTDSAGETDVFFILADEMGEILQSRRYGSIYRDHGRSIDNCEDGGFIIGGSSATSDSYIYDVYCLRIDDSGSLLWSETYGAPHDDWGSSIVACDAWGYAIAGSTRNYGANDYNMWLLRVIDPGSDVSIPGFPEMAIMLGLALAVLFMTVRRHRKKTKIRKYHHLAKNE